jgi:hypothetical protein
MKPEELESFFVEACDAGLGLVEGQASGRQPCGQPHLDLLGLLPGVAADDQVVGVPYERRTGVGHLPGASAGQVVAYASGLLQPVQCDIQQQW